MRFTLTMAELCGIILGDGYIHKSCNRIVISGSKEDMFYFKRRVIPLFSQLAKNLNPRIIHIKNKNAIMLELENKELFSIFTEKIGLHRGRKTNPQIPQEILTSKKLARAFLRGLFDTDGCLKFSKQSRIFNYYPRIQFGLCDSLMARQLSELFKLLEFNFGSWRALNHGFLPHNNMIYYHLSGKENLIKWMKMISSENPVQYTKYELWKREGHCVPKTTLLERLESIAK